MCNSSLYVSTSARYCNCNATAPSRVPFKIRTITTSRIDLYRKRLRDFYFIFFIVLARTARGGGGEIFPVGSLNGRSKTTTTTTASVRPSPTGQGASWPPWADDKLSDIAPSASPLAGAVSKATRHAGAASLIDLNARRARAPNNPFTTMCFRIQF